MATTKIKLIIFLSALVGVVLLVNVILLTTLSGVVSSSQEKATLAAIPAKIQLVTLGASTCSECFDTKAIIAQFKDANVTSEKKIEFDSVEGKAMVLKYNIAKIPAVIVTGEVSKSSSISAFLAQAGNDHGDAFVIESPIPPYVDAQTSDVRGLVVLNVITKKDCTDCYDLTPLLSQLKSTLTIKEIHEYDSLDPEALKLISTYHIDAVPTLVFDSEAATYPMITEVWPLVGTVEKDGMYVMRNLNPPYYNLTSREIEGVVSMTVLGDSSCTTCYNATKINSAILAQLGVKTKETKQVDVSSVEGKKLIDLYKITRVPTILLFGGMDKYPNLAQSWQGVGSIEDDGTYILRKLEVFSSPFMDLESGKIVIPSPVDSSESVQ